MKKLFLNSIWVLTLVAVCFTACKEEIIITDELDGFIPLMEETYLTNSKDITIEYASKEEINNLFLEHGLEVFFSDTENLIESRSFCTDHSAGLSNCQCTNPSQIITSLGDANGNGSLSAVDILLARKHMLGLITLPPLRANRIGRISQLPDVCSIPFPQSNGIDDTDLDIMAFTILGCTC